jgi:hypothetical protein
MMDQLWISLSSYVFHQDQDEIMQTNSCFLFTLPIKLVVLKQNFVKIYHYITSYQENKEDYFFLPIL